MTIAVLLDRVLELGRDFMFQVSGDLGLRIYNFASIVDKNHSEIKSLLSKDQELYLQLINISKYAHDNNLNAALQHISNLIINLNLNLDSISSLENSQRHIRLLYDKEKIRLLKKSWQFSSKSFKELIDIFWEEAPENFELFEKNNILYLEEVKSLEKKEKRFKEIGCPELSDSIRNMIQVLSFKSHYGYRKISIHWAACIMAKINKISKIDYKPTLYPYHECLKAAPEKVLSAIGEAENSNGSIFDHYLVFVPSYGTKNGKDLLLNIDTKSIVLGDKDGDCYFICYWERL